jgi:DNA repair exonuclease SbcCD nuclease subunit
LRWVFNTAIDQNIKKIIFAGDLFQDRQKIHIISYEKTFRLISEFFNEINHEEEEMQLYLLLGNHDMWFADQWDVSSVSPLRAIRNVHVIDQPCSLEIEHGLNIDFLPYTKNPIEDIKTHFKKKNDILISHCSIDGATLNSIYNTKAEISVEYEGDMVKVGVDSFKGWKKVFLGHYHCAQKLNDSVEYIGSPLELNFGEAHQEKHIIVFDTKTMETEYIINDFSPKHLIIKESELSKHKLENNFLQVIVDDITSTDILDMKKNVKDKGHRTIEFKEKVREKKDEPIQKIDLSGDTLDVWVKHKKPDGLDAEKLLSIGQDIIRRVS